MKLMPAAAYPSRIGPADPPSDFGGEQDGHEGVLYRDPSNRSGVRTAAATNSGSGAWRLHSADSPAIVGEA